MKFKTARKQIIAVVVSLFLFLSLGFLNEVYAAASLYLTASTTTTYPGNTFVIYPRVNTGGAATNAYTVSITFPSSLVQVVSMSKAGSICTIYVSEPSFTASTASINCGLPTPGYNGSSGGLGSITFRAKAKGTATISITGSSKVLANDGVGTNILGSRGSISINITDPPPPPVAAPTVTCSVGSTGEWIGETDITFNWNVPSGAVGFSYTLTQDPNSGAGRTNVGGGTIKSYSNLPDGTYYFKIAATNGSRWSNTTTYTLRIDTVPPKDLVIYSEPSNDSKIYELPLIYFEAADELSGIDHYEIKIDDGDFIVVQSPYQIESITSGKHTITVKAVDNASNSIEESIIIEMAEIPAPIIIKPKNGSYLPLLKEKLIVEGTAEPNSTVYIYLNGMKLAEVSSDDQGYFSYTHDQPLPSGEYELYAISKGETGIESSRSETVKFTVDPYALRIGMFVIPSPCLASLALVILTFLILLLLYLNRRYQEYRKRVKKSLAKVQKALDEEFDELEKDTMSGVETVTQRVSKKAGGELERDLSKEISEAEADIREAVEEIPSDKWKFGINIKGLGGKVKDLAEVFKRRIKRLWKSLKDLIQALKQKLKKPRTKKEKSKQK